MRFKYSTFDGIKERHCDKMIFKNSDNGLIVQIIIENEVIDLVYAKQIIFIDKVGD